MTHHQLDEMMRVFAEAAREIIADAPHGRLLASILGRTAGYAAPETDEELRDAAFRGLGRGALALVLVEESAGALVVTGMTALWRQQHAYAIEGEIPTRCMAVEPVEHRAFRCPPLEDLPWPAALDSPA
jgi:hypothetical protein